MSCGIYKIVNKVNNKVYIGQSVNIAQRWSAERCRAFNADSQDYNCSRARAFRKYGLDNFIFEIIEECEPSQLNDREIYWANFYNSYVPNGYNEARCGGQGHSYKLDNIDIVYQIINDLRYTTLTGIELGRKYGVSDQTISDINCGRSWRLEEEQYPIRSMKKVHYCQHCGCVIAHGMYCDQCRDVTRRMVERPSKELLLQEIATSSFTAVARKYGVSDKAIVRWCEYYGLPTHKKDLVALYKTIGPVV